MQPQDSGGDVFRPGESVQRRNIRDTPRICWIFRCSVKRDKAALLPVMEAPQTRMDAGLLRLLPIQVPILVGGQVAFPSFPKLRSQVSFLDSYPKTNVTRSNVETSQQRCQALRSQGAA